MYEINICHLYPDLLNLYGDRGNLLSIQKRCEWNAIQANVASVSLGDRFDAEKYDLVLIGGGQDYEQSLLQPDLVGQKANELKNYISQGRVLLAICGGYQLLGRSYETAEGKSFPFLGALDFVTVAGSRRMIGDMAFSCRLPIPGVEDQVVVGFENHMGKTFLGSGVQPMGRVIAGYGNNGEDGTEGAVYKNTYCSYGHGSLLPKNPVLADYLIHTALKMKYRDFTALKPLDDALEASARDVILKRI